MACTAALFRSFQHETASRPEAILGALLEIKLPGA